MKLYCQDLAQEEHGQLLRAISRWREYLGIDVQFVDRSEECDVVLLDSDRPFFGQTGQGVRIVSVGAARIRGDAGHLSKPIRGFQTAALLASVAGC
jgi:predicted Zn-dependent protease